MASLFSKKDRKIRIKVSDDRHKHRGLNKDTKHDLVVSFLFVFSFILLLSLANFAGPAGRWLEHGLLVFGGSAGWLLPFILIAFAFAMMQSEFKIRMHHWIGLIMIVLGITGLLQIGEDLNIGWKNIWQGTGGGMLGFLALLPLYNILGLWASIILLVALIIGGILVLFETTIKRLLSPVFFVGKIIKRPFQKSNEEIVDSSNQTFDEEVPEQEVDSEPRMSVKQLTKLIPTFKPRADKTTVPVQEPLIEIKPSHRKIDIPLELLKTISSKPTSGDIELQKEKIQKTLANFGIEVEMGEISVGPTVTQYTLKPAEGVKLVHITALANDLALALAAHPIRIEAPIPGKALVGVEVPNQAVATVGLKEILISEQFKKRKSNLSVALGKDVAGRAWIADLENMPHLLIAGATGSGKSVCINSMLISLLYTNSPDDLKFIIIDPKRVELAAYNQIPHLLTPVIIEIDKTIAALKWVVAEMDRRYQTLAAEGKRNIQAFNQNGGQMPYIIVVIDELADLMAVAAHEVETAIIRLAQMARAVGIHLIVATQRPSVDVITGLIKANITNRIAFAVASSVDSRTILDASGAEKLLGRGDCLYLSPQLTKPKRLQCALVSDEEIERVMSYIGGQEKPKFDSQITAKSTNIVSGWSSDSDELFDEAKAVIVRAGKASASLLQRRLRVGYARAARLLDLLEEQGIIGPGEGAKPREVLIDRETFESQVTDNLSSKPVADDFSNGEIEQDDQVALGENEDEEINK
ncbi:MAG: DNA translocase FtsK 4TM domain-containing protein [Patescibacteria group bacterium]